MRSRQWVLVLLMTMVEWINSFGQAYNFRQLSIQNGLPQSQAFCLEFDSKQRVWIGTQGGGVCLYDGTEFTYFTKSDSLISNRIFCLFLKDNDVWIGQRGGLTQFSENGQFIANYRFNLPDTYIQDMVWFQEELLLASNRGIYKLVDGELVSGNYTPNTENLSVTRFFQSDSNELWLCSAEGLLNYKDPFNRINRARGLPVNEVECAIEFNGKWLIGTYGGGVRVYDPLTGIKPATWYLESQNEIITCFYKISESELWIGTQNNGIYVYKDREGIIKNYRVENGLSNNHVKTIHADQWSNIWIGTSGGGISIFRNTPFIKYSTESGLNGNYIFSVANDDAGNLWVGTEGAGVTRVNDTSVVVFDEEYGFVSDKVKTILVDRSGTVWFGTEGSGIGIFSTTFGKDTIVRYTRANGLSSDWIKSIVEHPESGEIFIATVNGGILKALKTKAPSGINYEFIRLKFNSQIPERINFLFFHQKQLWFIANESTYGRVDGKNVRLYNEEGIHIRNAIASDKYIWLGTMDNGILRLEMNGDSLQSRRWITSSDGLSSNNIYQLHFTNNEIWVGTERGVDRLLLDAGFEIDSVIHYGAEEGFEGVETNSNAGDIDQAGNLWFGTVNGLYSYQGGSVNYADKNPPVLYFTDFKIYYNSIELSQYADFYENGKMLKALVLPYDTNHVGFSFKAIHYAYPDKIRYRWKLSGVDKDWTPPSKIHDVPYANLLPGQYTFSVQASVDDTWNSDPLTISFEIDQPYWQKWWFKALYYSGILLLITIVVFAVLWRQRIKNKRIREKLELEKNMLELEQKALRLQMNPHFIFNVLNSIHNLIILNDPDKARYALAKFSKLMRRVLENSREKLISIDNEKETLENYVQLERLTSGIDVTLDFEIDPELDTSEEILPPLMIQPFIENALIHGLRNTDRAGKIIVGFNLLSEHLLECYIEDNGRGRADAAKLVAQKESYHKSTALRVTQERLASINRKEGVNAFEILDLKDENGQASGTRVVLRLEI